MNVYCTCPSVPPELIAACGHEPVRLVPARPLRPALRLEGMCPFALAWLETLLHRPDRDESLCVFTTACDPMRRACDLYNQKAPRPAFLLNVPSTTTPNAFDYYRGELVRLRDFLCMDAKAPFDEIKLDAANQPSNEPTGKLNLALLGGPLPAPLREQIDRLLIPSRAVVRLDATEGRLAAPAPDPHEIDPLTRLARRYFAIPAIWRRPNDPLFAGFAAQIEQNQIDGVLLLRYIFCDLWHSSAAEFKRRLPVPLIEIDLDGGETLTASAVSRIEAFVEAMSR